MTNSTLQQFARAATLAAGVLAALAACSGAGSSSPGGAMTPPVAGSAALPAGNYIKHIVIIVQENRSFDNLFNGFTGADFATSGHMSNGAKVALHATTFETADVAHGWKDSIADYDGGKMDGFNLNANLQTGHPGGTFAYAYLKRSVVAPYWAMARQYVLADHMFPTMHGQSFTAHLDLIAGTTNLNSGLAEVEQPSETPWGCDAPAGTTTSVLNQKRVISYFTGPFPCFTQFRTIADTLDAAHQSWKYYAPSITDVSGPGILWTAFDAIKKVRKGPDWANIVSPETTVLSDPAAGRLPAVSWVIPKWANSDHAGANFNLGPSWVASVVNAIGNSPDWNSTAIIVVWDDWGGWYDHLQPPQADFRGLGIRVPCIVISPYAKKGYVSHTQYEFGSILKLVEQTFGLPALGTVSQGYSDARANSMLDSFDFTQAPRAFTPIPAAKTPAYFLAQPHSSSQAPDDD